MVVTMGVKVEVPLVVGVTTVGSVVLDGGRDGMNDGTGLGA